MRAGKTRLIYPISRFAWFQSSETSLKGSCETPANMFGFSAIACIADVGIDALANKCMFVLCLTRFEMRTKEMRIGRGRGEGEYGGAIVCETWAFVRGRSDASWMIKYENSRLDIKDFFFEKQ